MTRAVHYIAYASKLAISSALNENIFISIQEQSIRNNTNSGITGFLLFKDGKFFQYFEGDEIVCLQLLSVLRNDPRHNNLTVLAQGNMENRLFNDWAMACFNLNETKYELELSDKFPNFEVFEWQPTDIQKIISSLSQYYLHNFQPEEISYLKLLLKKAINQNRLFSIFQLILSVLILIALISLIFLKL